MKINFSKTSTISKAVLKEHRPHMLRMLSYPTYLATNHWRETRQKALKHGSFECKECAATDNLHIHHLNYRNLGQERMRDLEVLCGDCHQRLHDSEVVF